MDDEKILEAYRQLQIQLDILLKQWKTVKNRFVIVGNKTRH